MQRYRLQHAGFGTESYNFYDSGERSRITRDIDIQGNFITYSRLPTALENYKASIIAQEVDGLMIKGNLFDSRFFWGMFLDPVERKDSTGKVIAVYPNKNIVIENNASRDFVRRRVLL